MQAIYCLNEIWIESITLPIITVRVGCKFYGPSPNVAYTAAYHSQWQDAKLCTQI